MPDTPVMPELPDHPEPHILRWTSLEVEAIKRYGADCFRLGVEAGTPKWLPIESAPKDGTAILVCLSDSDSGYVVFWVDPAKEIRDYVGSKIGWHIAYCGDFLGPCDAPTHWQPLPSPPTQEDKHIARGRAYSAWKSMVAAAPAQGKAVGN